MLAATLAVVAPFVLANEKSLFHIPDEADFRAQTIVRVDKERDWPFAVPEGVLLCAYLLGERTVFFVEKLTEAEYADKVEPRTVIVSVDPLDLAFSNIGSQELFAVSDLAELIRRVAPIERAGQALCDQPRGAHIGRGEL